MCIYLLFLLFINFCFIFFSFLYTCIVVCLWNTDIENVRENGFKLMKIRVIYVIKWLITSQVHINFSGETYIHNCSWYNIRHKMDLCERSPESNALESRKMTKWLLWICTPLFCESTRTNKTNNEFLELFWNLNWLMYKGLKNEYFIGYSSMHYSLFNYNNYRASYSNIIIIQFRSYIKDKFTFRLCN